MMKETSDKELSGAMRDLENHLDRVEGELDLECAELKELLGNNHPRYREHISHLSASLDSLRASLKNVQGLMGNSAEANAGGEAAEKAGNDQKNENEEGLSAKEQSKIRHDEKITLSGIFRALLMADEPVQRYKHDDKKK